MAPTPVYVKGGVWTNVEDQILKAAIQKYRTHQWSKVAALLHKKSARHCEIRWNEFLNPQLNFTGFTREEDTKLLTLARKLPNQWRTISNLMGRTAQICMERYNKLLSEGEAAEDNAGDGDDLRLGTSLEFKVGDLNPHSDTRTALPDKEELDDDEREMLAEARARLLNTQGSKATARVRERMLEESKRIAELQKRRELKQAGINVAAKKHKRKYDDEIDYNTDIPYEQTPMPGIYDTKEEDRRTAKELKRYEQLVQNKGIHEKLPEKEKPKHDGQKKRGRKGQEPESEEPQPKKARPSVKDNTHAFRHDRNGLHLSKPGTGSNMESVNHEDALATSRRKLIEARSVGAVLQTPHSQSPTKSSSRRSSATSHHSTQQVAHPRKVDVRKTLAKLFQSMPSPKNDFEIVIDVSDDEEISAGLETPPESDHEQERTEDLELDCLEVRVLPTPEFIEHPNTSIDDTYNELLSNLMTTTPYKATENQSEIYKALDKALSKIHPGDSLSAPTNAYDNTSAQEIQSHIAQTKAQITALQSQFTHVDELIKQNTGLNHEVCQDKLPLLREMQQGYYMNYRLYREEKRELTRRAARLKLEINKLTPEGPK